MFPGHPRRSSPAGRTAPAASRRDDAGSAESREDVVNEPAPPVVLIVDDDPEGREMYAAALAAAGFAVEQASDGFEATDKAFRLKPQVILMDLLMPRLDGWDVVEWLKKNPATRAIPIVAVTGAGPERVRQVREAGCREALTKPCDPDLLLAAIQRALGQT
jgi:two-component system cell cycle response regulator DivK